MMYMYYAYVWVLVCGVPTPYEESVVTVQIDKNVEIIRIEGDVWTAAYT